VAPSHLLYLHGFRSSPGSAKAVRLRVWLQQHHPEVRWWCPQLPPSPALAMRMVADTLRTWPAGRFAVVGSSLGGFYATRVAETHGCKAVLLNPAVNPARDLAAYVGTLTSYHDPEATFEFLQAHVDELQALHAPLRLHLDRYAAVIAKGDEVLDWREMRARYAGCALRLLEGSDHGLSDFDDHLPFITRFLNLAP
jgi:uncharacterized protein